MRLIHLLRRRLTYRLLALLLVLIVALMWVLGRDIQIGDKTFKPDAVGGMLVAVGAFLWYLVPSLSNWAEKPIFGASETRVAEDDPFTKNRKLLLEAVDQIWLSGLLDHLLNQQQSLAIDLRFLEPDKVAQRAGGQPYPLSDNRAVRRAFDDFGRQMVLLGEPGAGKTVLLLQLTRALWQEARSDASKRLPLVFPLASWAAKRLPFDRWLETELRERYGASGKLAAAHVKSEQLIYLLDGLDEVVADQREDCLRALKAFAEDSNRHVEYVLCSRRAEFERLATRLNVSGEIVLQPLLLDRVREYLRHDDFAALRTLLDENTIIREDFARIPFMVNTMAYVTRGKSIEAMWLLLAGKDDADSLRAAFLDAYVTQRLGEQADERYPNERTRRWLRWLARQLIHHDQTDFYLENMQPDWLDTPKQMRRWKWAVRIVSGLRDGLVFGLVVGMVSGLRDGLVFGLAVGMVSGLADGAKEQIDMSDQLSLSIGRGVLIKLLVIGLVVGLVVGLAAGLAVGLVFGLMVGLSSQTDLRYRIKPGQGIWRSLGNGLSVVMVVGLAFGLVSGLVVGLAFGLADGPVVGLMVGLVVGLVAGQEYGLRAFIQHYVLRFMLTRAGHIPFRRYDQFLDYAHDRAILRKVGGGYRFVHDYLRQHLARPV